jgi:hypothetical protein
MRISSDLRWVPSDEDLIGHIEELFSKELADEVAKAFGLLD